MQNKKEKGKAICYGLERLSIGEYRNIYGVPVSVRPDHAF